MIICALQDSGGYKEIVPEFLLEFCYSARRVRTVSHMLCHDSPDLGFDLLPIGIC